MIAYSQGVVPHKEIKTHLYSYTIFIKNILIILFSMFNVNTIGYKARGLHDRPNLPNDRPIAQFWILTK
jgi:hypothetical protein